MKLDNPHLGINNFQGFTKTIEASLFQRPEDFIVEEIFPDFVSTVDYNLLTMIKDKMSLFKKKRTYLHASLVKRGISTFNAIDEISSNSGIDKNDIGICGLKDTNGWTSQKISIKGGSIKKIAKIKNKNFFLKDFGYKNNGLSIRQHKGNRFTIVARNIEEPRNSVIKKMSILKNKLTRYGIPNFYDQQRFGRRQNNHLIGKEIIKGNFEKAVSILLTDTRDENENMKKLRNFISKNWGKWDKCLEKSREVKDVNCEADVLLFLTKNKKDFLGALKSISLGRFFLSSYMSYLFNKTLSDILSKGKKIERLEKIGFDVKISKDTKPFYDKVLRKEKIKPSNFKIDKDLFLNSGIRKTHFYPKNFDFKLKGYKLIINFDLGIGNYATIILRVIFSDVKKID